MSYNRTIKDRHATVNRGRYPSVVKYVEKVMEWSMWPSRCINGEVFILFHNHLIPYQEFIELQPNPREENFRKDLTNVDKSHV